MSGHLFEQKHPTAKLLQRLLNRDVALWIGDGFEVTPQNVAALAGLAQLPWRVVLVESTSDALADEIERVANSTPNLLQIRGYAHIIASDLDDLTLPPRSLPIFFLNGRALGKGSDSASLGRRASERRRLNQIAHLAATKPTEVVLLSFGRKEPLNEFQEYWTEELRSLVSVISTDVSDLSAINEWLLQKQAPLAIDFYAVGAEEFSRELQIALFREYSPESLVVKFRGKDGSPIEFDITSAELVEQPLLDRYEIILAKDIVPLQPEELSFDELAAFFNRSKSSWRPFAAGLPWPRETSAIRRVRKGLSDVEKAGSEANQILHVTSESGAGGTTFVRFLAFALAAEGFPALVAKPEPFRPSATEIESFLHRVRQTIGEDHSRETPWLIVFDTVHWESREQELRSFLAHITRRGRAAVVLTVTSERLTESAEIALPGKPIATLQHNLELNDALLLGDHLNKYLKPHARTKSSSEWTSFWQQHRPDIDVPVASFWIALEFWLKGLLNLGDSIQQWLYRQFKSLKISDGVRMLILEIAALSIERRPFPEALMSVDGEMRLPFGVLLDDIRADAPGLGLVRDAAGTQRRWALAHTVLGRYLLVSTYYDRALCEKLSLSSAENPTHLRLLLLDRLVQRVELAQHEFRELALDFAIRIFKLDPGSAVEFFPLWRDVFETLNHVSSVLRNTSRTFLHHIAISCRRVATDTIYFDATSEEKEKLLFSAVRHIEFALQLPRVADEESDLNLYNSLALAYQNLSDAKRLANAPEPEIQKLREKATEATLRAQQEDPFNAYVLETSARNLVQSATHDPERRVTDATLALVYIYEAIVRNRATGRTGQLARLLRQAIGLLRGDGARTSIEKLCKSGISLGYVALAWIDIVESGRDEEVDLDRLDLSPERASSALSILANGKVKRDWLLLKFQYDLLAIAEPRNFERQLTVLEELTGTEYRLPFQYQLEHAVLLHQRGRHHDASVRFKSLRGQLREHDAIVDVPSRMRWLLARDGVSRVICDARVQSTTGSRYYAIIKDLAGESVPFIPQDFGQKRFSVGQLFKVAISFGAMGPFAKPPSGEVDE